MKAETRPSRPRHLGLERWIRILVVFDLLIAAGLAAAVFVGLWTTGNRPAQLSAVAAATVSTPSPELMPMGLAHIPTSSACVLCHTGGGEIKAVPAILHPIEGWRRCVTCHTNESLGRVAPGHDGIAETECLNCHKNAPAGPAITQPHAALHDQKCLDCHGGVAHLPSSMATAREDQCVICHKPTTLPPPSYPHAANVSLECRTCHQSQEVGALPIDHALRSDSTCLLCHEIRRVGESPGASVPAPGPTSLLYRLRLS